MKPLCIIPARGGSKRLPGKNLAVVGGASLTARAITEARRFARMAGVELPVLVDTDDAAIATEARRWGAEVPFLRPAELASDEASTIDCIFAVLDRLAASGRVYDSVILLQPTSPLRSADDIRGCWQVFGSERPAVVSVARSSYPAELLMLRDADATLRWRERDMTATRRTQDYEATWRLTGAIYVATTALLREHRSFIVPGMTRGIEMPDGRAVDVDDAADLDAARRALASTAVATMQIGKRAIGAGQPCYVIAEAGVNHNGDEALAHRLVDAAADAGADAVKFQTFDPDQLVAPDAPKAEYQVRTVGAEESQLAMLRRLTLPASVFADLAAHAARRGIGFLSTAFDPGSARMLAEMGMPAFKVPSGELTNVPFIAELARYGRPLLISTGMGSLEEVARAVGEARAHGDGGLALFHCVSNYPAAPEDCNLRAMATMRAAFGVPVGWSDHTPGIEISVAAVAAGAELIEKHLTLDRALPGPDHAASLEPAEFGALVRSIRAVEASLGAGVKVPAASESNTRDVARRSVHVARALPAGHRLVLEDLELLRPGTGMAPEMLHAIVGRTLRRAIAARGLLHPDDLA